MSEEEREYMASTKRKREGDRRGGRAHRREEQKASYRVSDGQGD